ncbi:MAG: DUF420 domain-containing protein [Elusimicrobiota bacterium]
MPLGAIPRIDACLNAAAAGLLILGYVFIRQGKLRAHRAAMLSALACSTAFLAGYLYYHAHAGIVRYQGRGLSRIAYFSILSTHTVLAAITPPLALYAAFLALSGRFGRHRKWAKTALPVWLYVSATGVVIYAMLFGF